MRRIKLITFALAALLVSGTGCLKDKGFENNEYGINDADNSPAGVGFVYGIRYKNTVGLDVSVDPQTVSNELSVSLLAGNTSSVDIPVTLQVDQTLIDEYNNDFSTDIQPLDAALYNLSSLTVVIPAGQRSGRINLVIPSTAGLDPNQTYGVGFKIVSAPGYVIASNQDQLIVEIGIKNRYDGKYNMTGYHNRVPYTFPYIDEPMLMITSGPADVTFFWPQADDFGHPIGVAPGSLNWYGPAIGPVITFDLATNRVANVFNAGGPTPITVYSGPVATDNYYDPATKTIYVAWMYNNNPARGFFDTLRFTGPR